MGYRSSGMIYIPVEVYKELPEDKHRELVEEWSLKEHDENGYVYSFEYWKWDDEFDDVKFWNKIYRENKDVDLIVIGEDSAVVVEPRFSKLGYSMNIEVY